MEVQGVPIELDDTLPEKTRVVWQYRHPRSRKRRIREKWSLRASNYKPSDVWVLFVKDGPVLAMHSRTWEAVGTWLWPESMDQPRDL